MVFTLPENPVHWVEMRLKMDWLNRGYLGIVRNQVIGSNFSKCSLKHVFCGEWWYFLMLHSKRFIFYHWENIGVHFPERILLDATCKFYMAGCVMQIAELLFSPNIRCTLCHLMVSFLPFWHVSHHVTSRFPKQFLCLCTLRLSLTIASSKLIRLMFAHCTIITPINCINASVFRRWMGKSCPSPATRRMWRAFALPRTPSWCRSSGEPPVAAPMAPLRKSMWWMCALRQTSPLNTSWLWQSSGLLPLLCLTSVPSCSQTGTSLHVLWLCTDEGRQSVSYIGLT